MNVIQIVRLPFRRSIIRRQCSPCSSETATYYSHLPPRLLCSALHPLSQTCPSCVPSRRFGSAPSGKGKAKKDTKKSFEFEGQSTQQDDHTKKYIQMIDSKPRPRNPYTEDELAEHARIARAYNAEKRLEHDDVQHDISVKIWMKNEALKNIGGQWGIEANKIEEGNYPPLWRKHPSFTPPIEGFDVRKYDSMNPIGKKEE